LDFSVHALWGGDHRPPLNDWQTRTVWPKNIKIENTAETKTPTSYIPKTYQKWISKWSILLIRNKHITDSSRCRSVWRSTAAWMWLFSPFKVPMFSIASPSLSAQIWFIIHAFKINARCEEGQRNECSNDLKLKRVRSF